MVSQKNRCICFVHYLMDECNTNLNRVASNVMINLKQHRRSLARISFFRFGLSRGMFLHGPIPWYVSSHTINYLTLTVCEDKNRGRPTQVIGSCLFFQFLDLDKLFNDDKQHQQEDNGFDDAKYPNVQFFIGHIKQLSIIL